MRRIFCWSVAVILGYFLSGCSSTAPVLMQLPAVSGSSADFGYTVGVQRAIKSGDQKLSHLKTYQMLGFYQYGGRMPRREEVDYLSRSIADYLRDTKTFTYVYDDPFNRNDVDLIIVPKIEVFDLSNSILGTVMGNVSFVPVVGMFISLSQIIGVPQETFHFEYKFTIDVENRAGKTLASYTYSGEDWEWANMYDQPFGNWLWYDSLFQREFFKALDKFKADINADASRLMVEAK